MVKCFTQKCDDLLEVRVEIKGEEIGYMQLVSSNNTAEIRFLSVHNAYRRKGYAKMMLGKAIEMLHKQTLVKNISVVPHPEDVLSGELISMEELYAMYTKLGFDFTDKEIDKNKLKQMILDIE